MVILQEEHLGTLSSLASSITLPATYTINIWVKNVNLDGTQQWANLYLQNSGYRYVLDAHYGRIGAGNWTSNSTPDSSRLSLAAGDPLKVADTWHLVTVTYDGSTMEYFANGVSIGTVDPTANATPPTAIDVLNGPASQEFAAEVRDLRVYEGVATSQQIADSYNNNGVLSLEDGLVAKWLFDGNLQDETGNHNATSPTGAETYVATGGNEWFEYPGNGTDYVSVPYSEDLVPTDAMTVSTWIKYSALGNHYDNFIIANGHNAIPSSDHMSWVLGRVRQNEGVVPANSPINNSGKFYFQIQTQNGYISAVDHQGDDLSAGSIDTEVWYHVVGTYDGSMVRIYVDGVLAGEYPQTGQIVQFPGQPITMNYHVIPELTAPGNAPGQAALSQDDTRIWNRALAAGEITSLYNETNLYSNEGETPQGENTMDAIYLKIAGSLADAFPSEPKVRMFDAAGAEVTSMEIGFGGVEGDELVFVFPNSDADPATALAGHFIEIYDGYGDGIMQTPPGALTYEIGYFTIAGSVYTSVATAAVPAQEQLDMENGAARAAAHPLIEFDWDGTGPSPTASILSTQLQTGAYGAAATSTAVTPMKIRSDAQINHGFSVGGVYYPNVDAMMDASVYQIGAISFNDSVGNLAAWTVAHNHALYLANPNTGLLVNFDILNTVDLYHGSVQDSALALQASEDSSIRAEFSIADGVLASDMNALSINLGVDLAGEANTRSLADSNLAVDLADAVNTLNTDIATEATERAAQDSVLKSDLDAQIVAEDVARSAEDSVIRSTMAAEDAAIRNEMSIGDADLDTYITSEISYLTSTMGAEDTAIRAEFSVADSQLNEDLVGIIDSQVSSLEAEDSSIRMDFDSEISRVESDLADVELDVSNEHSMIRSELAASIDGLVDGAPNLLNTLDELAAAINDDDNFATTMTTALATATADRGAIRSEFAAADSVVKSDLDAQMAQEVLDRVAGDSVVKSDLEAQIAATGSGSTSGLSALRADMEDEDSLIRGEFADADSALKSELVDDLANLDVASKDADSALKSDLDAQMAQEIADRSNADNTATTDRANIRTEFAAADSEMKSDLESQLINVESEYLDSDSVLKSDLEAQLGVEEQARIDADSVLKSDLDASIVTASNAYVAADSVVKSDLEAQLAVVIADVAQNEADGDDDRSLIRSELAADIAAVQADVDQNEADADLGLSDAAVERSAMRADLEAADSVLKSDLDAQIVSVEGDMSNEHSLIRSELAAEIDGLVDGAPALLDTLNEIAAAINDDENFATTMTTALATATTDRGAIRNEFSTADAALQTAIDAVAADMIAGDSGLTADLAQEALDRIAGDSVLKSDLDASIAAAGVAYIAADSVIKSDLDAQVSDLEGRAQADFAQMYDFCRKDGDTLLGVLVAGTTFPLSQDASYIKFVTLNGLVISAAEYTEVLNGGGTAIAGIQFAYDLAVGDTFVVHYNKVVNFLV